MQVLAADQEAPAGCPVSLVDETTSVYMQLGEGDVDHSKELEKHLKEQVRGLRLRASTCLVLTSCYRPSQGI